MKALKDKKKFGWDKPPKNRNCKKFGVQYNYQKDRQLLHKLLFHIDDWKTCKVSSDIICDIKYYYEYYVLGEHYYDSFIHKYKDTNDYILTSDDVYYNTLITHIKELYNTLKLRGDEQYY